MASDTGMKFVETNTASVKMTVGVPFNVGSFGSTSSEENDCHIDDIIETPQGGTSGSTSLEDSLNTLPEEQRKPVGKTNNISSLKDELEASDLKTNNYVQYSNSNAVLSGNQNKTSDKRPSLDESNTMVSSQRYNIQSDCQDEEEANGLSSVSPSDLTKDTSSSTKNIPSSEALQIQSGRSPQLNSHQQMLVTQAAVSRVNPFNRDLAIEDDHFSSASDNFFRAHGQSIDSVSSSSLSHGFDWQHAGEESAVTFAELGLSEDHFSHPQGHFGLSGTEELELAIENCKEMIRSAPPQSEKQKNLVLKLVQLRIKLQEIKEGPEPLPEDVKVVLSHKMQLRTSRTSKYYCEKCNGGIWGMLQVWYKCIECGFRCHEKCLSQIMRKCAKAKVLENPVLCMEISPIDSGGLAAQTYRCAECRTAISFKSGESEPRLCDYTGRYYCEFCHWNDTFKIPARVLHNWDFTQYKVCRASKQFLRLMQRKAVIRIQDINPMLFVYVDQLNEIKKLREEMMIMKRYILSCTSAMNAKLLLMLESRQHFVENSDIYSMQDLLDTEELLLPELVKVHSSWAQHIKVDCELCQGRGFCCELCKDNEVLFPFDNTAVVCAQCSSVLHRHCFAKKGVCPRCARRQKRRTNEA